jgi:ligand-binding SRPBCC domain-containing protein
MEVLRRETIVPRGLEETFAFFSDARNLERLTPPWVGFEILTPTPINMGAGTLIDYRIRVHGIPLKWKTEIVVWEPPHCFVDVQVRGPYRWWHHTHRFEACAGGTRVMDEVEYRAPFSWISHGLMVNRDVAKIFAYRESALAQELGGTVKA